MTDAWTVLERAGVPDGAPRAAGTAFVADEVRAAVAHLARDESAIPAGAGEALLAWLRAIRHHWPSRYDDLAGAPGYALEARLEPDADANRYLKLRRIAIENLSSLL